VAEAKAAGIVSNIGVSQVVACAIVTSRNPIFGQFETVFKKKKKAITLVFLCEGGYPGLDDVFIQIGKCIYVVVECLDVLYGCIN